MFVGGRGGQVHLAEKALGKKTKNTRVTKHKQF